MMLNGLEMDAAEIRRFWGEDAWIFFHGFLGTPAKSARRRESFSADQFFVHPTTGPDFPRHRKYWAWKLPKD
jgi:hypothetical protein